MSSAVASPRGLEITSDVMYEDWFSIMDIKKNDYSYRLLGEPVPITVRRMAKNGRKSPVTKKVVKLEVGVGSSGQLCTSEQACRRFIERMNGALS